MATAIKSDFDFLGVMSDNSKWRYTEKDVVWYIKEIKK